MYPIWCGSWFVSSQQICWTDDWEQALFLTYLIMSNGFRHDWTLFSWVNSETFNLLELHSHNIYILFFIILFTSTGPQNLLTMESCKKKKKRFLIIFQKKKKGSLSERSVKQTEMAVQDQYTNFFFGFWLIQQCPKPCSKSMILMEHSNNLWPGHLGHVQMHCYLFYFPAF